MNSLSVRSSFLKKLYPAISTEAIQIYRMAHEKPARRLVDQRGRRSRCNSADTAELHRVYDNMLQPA
jgi:hypothetical protein